uniref:Uncharacterized protein n=1 Tax=Arundo donax TaxID=35708 RepID=A0A0A9APS4_ARUDO
MHKTFYCILKMIFIQYYHQLTGPNNISIYAILLSFSLFYPFRFIQCSAHLQWIVFGEW